MSSKRKAEKDDVSSSEDSDAEERKKIAKKEAKKKSKEKSGKSSEGNYTFEIGKKRNLTVREFKGKVLIDIREYYEDDSGNMKPGKKGISLSVEQWGALKEHISQVDEAIEDLK
ncbi:activated RNA polymerase II transcriptional coactivator p15-like [Dendronephthya gigantea]|uniref:activated RNA polymerase II transcriptional coactivator p15-like n=1 Tax=Dendronephthya gigantea TaxID=151771 RepID=UPI00106B70D8|nr:activated RNA polymerase II transcriptional coactivator p15-like [Dendronephthya gigantea]